MMYNHTKADDQKRASDRQVEWLNDAQPRVIYDHKRDLAERKLRALIMQNSRSTVNQRCIVHTALGNQEPKTN